MKQSKDTADFLRTYLKGEGSFGGWGIISNLLGLLCTFILLKNLDVFNYGVYILIIAFYSLVSHFTLSSLQGVILNDLSRFIGEGEDSRAKKLFLENTYLQISVGLVLSLIVFMSANLIASFYGKDVGQLIRIISPLFLINALAVNMRMFLQARLLFNIIASRPVVSSLLRLIFLAFFIVFMSLDVRSALIAHVLASFFAMFLFVPPFLRTYKKEWGSIRPQKGRVLLPIIQSYGKWPLINEGFKYSVLDLKPWLVKIFVNTEAVAIFSVAESFYGLFKGVLPVKTLKTIVPRIIHNKQKTERTLLLSIKALFICSLGLLLLGVVSVPIVILLFFPQYKDSILLFYILIPAILFRAFRTPARTFLTAHRRQKFIFFLGVLNTVLALIIPIVFLPLIGVAGVAIERIITAIIMSLLMFRYIVKNYIPLHIWKSLFGINAHDKEVAFRAMNIIRTTFRR